MSALNVVDENDVNRLEEWRHTENCCRTSLTFTPYRRMLSKVVKLLNTCWFLIFNSGKKMENTLKNF
jgi:hypothetical protein